MIFICQHYIPMNYSTGQETFERTLRNDKLKKDYCANNGVSFVEIDTREHNTLETIDKYLNF